MSEASFFRRQAGLQREQAAGADLANVRDRCERAALAWEAMAERAEKSERLRAGRTN